MTASITAASLEQPVAPPNSNPPISLGEAQATAEKASKVFANARICCVLFGGVVGGTLGFFGGGVGAVVGVGVGMIVGAALYEAFREKIVTALDDAAKDLKNLAGKIAKFIKDAAKPIAIATPFILGGAAIGAGIGAAFGGIGAPIGAGLGAGAGLLVGLVIHVLTRK